MYIKGKNLIFIHIPKNAGISVEYTLNDIYFKNENNKLYFNFIENMPAIIKYLYFYVFILRIIINLIVYQINPLDNFNIGIKYDTLSMHFSARQYKKFLNNDNYNKCIKFTIIRNPYNRTLSMYYYITPKFLQSKKNFIKFLLNIKNKKLKNNWFNTQHSYVVDENGNNIVDYYIRFENLQNDWYLFCKKYNITYRKLVKINSNKNNIEELLLDNYTKQLIYDIYKIDFIYFNYNK